MNKVFAENSLRKITFRKTVNLYLSLLLSPWACRRVCPTSHFENLSVTVLLTLYLSLLLSPWACRRVFRTSRTSMWQCF